MKWWKGLNTSISKLHICNFYIIKITFVVFLILFTLVWAYHIWFVYLKISSLQSSTFIRNLLHVIQGSSTDIKCECLDILCDVLHRYGSLIVAYHEELLRALLSQLNFTQATIRKKTISCIGNIVLNNVELKIIFANCSRAWFLSFRLGQDTRTWS